MLLSLAMLPTTRGVGFFPDLHKRCIAVECKSELQVEMPMGKRRVCWFQCQSLWARTVPFIIFLPLPTSSTLIRLPVHLKRNVNTRQSPAFLSTSICFLIVCLLGCKWMLDVNECCHLSLSGQPLDEASVSASSKADVIPINYSENCIISGPSWGDSLSPTSPFELRLFRYLIRATLYVLASCWYK